MCKRKKSKLYIAQQKAQEALNATNELIFELGEYDRFLYTQLVSIQNAFDQIRNVPSDKKIQYDEIKSQTLEWKQQVDQINKDYNFAQTIGWVALFHGIPGSILFIINSIRNKRKLERIFILISKDAETRYLSANEEIKKRIIDEIKPEGNTLHEAIDEIKGFGLNYRRMTEEQQHKLGTYVNLMSASIQTLVSPITNLLPKYSEKDLIEYIDNKRIKIKRMDDKVKTAILYYTDLLYGVDELNKKEIKLLWKTFKKKKARKRFALKRKQFPKELMYMIVDAINYKKVHGLNES